MRHTTKTNQPFPNVSSKSHNRILKHIVFIHFLEKFIGSYILTPSFRGTFPKFLKKGPPPIYRSWSLEGELLRSNFTIPSTLFTSQPGFSNPEVELPSSLKPPRSSHLQRKSYPPKFPTGKTESDQWFQDWHTQGNSRTQYLITVSAMGESGYLKEHLRTVFATEVAMDSSITALGQTP